MFEKSWEKIPWLKKMLEEMDTWFVVNSALDMYSEDAFPKDMDTDSMVWATSHNPKILSIAKKFLKDVIGDKLYSIVRNTVKYKRL